MANRPPRRTGTRATPRVPREVRIRAVTKKIRSVAEDHTAEGGTAAEWMQALLAAGDSGGRTHDSPGFELPTFELLGVILERWHTDSRWLDSDGNPRPIRASGPDGFAGLCREVGVNRGAPSIAKLGLAVGILRRNPHGALLPTDRTAVVRRSSPAMMELFGIAIAALQSTVRYNLTPELAESARRLERGVYHQPIPAELEAEFHRFARRLGIQWIYQVDNWLIAHRASARDRSVLHVGAHACAFSHPSAPERRLVRRSPRG